ncbi:SgcJ/EcaC family oxidoreductase [Streptomyces sp. NPDC057623]|uniref:SgcJ/EcaC family oxidoreductase n=1 Tax=Streptomyces sp. NPDC057623 TaxID=3346187 RepID=UPI0036B15BAA
MTTEAADNKSRDTAKTAETADKESVDTADNKAGDTTGGRPGDDADRRAIAEIVAAVERTQRAKDPDGFLALFHPDALWTTGHSKVLIGFDAIAEFTRAVLPTAVLDGEVTYEVTHTQFLRPDVAAVKVRQVYHSPSGDTEGAPLYVLTSPPPEGGGFLRLAP